MCCVSLSPFFPGAQNVCLVPPPATSNQCGWCSPLNISKYVESRRIEVKRTSDKFWGLHTGVPGSRYWSSGVSVLGEAWLTSLKFWPFLSVCENVSWKTFTSNLLYGTGRGRLVSSTWVHSERAQSTPEMRQKQSKNSPRLLLVGKAGEPRCLLPFMWWWFLSPLLPSLFNDLGFFFPCSASEEPQLPFILCKACGAAVVLLFSDKIELQVSCGDLGLNQSSPLWSSQ